MVEHLSCLYSIQVWHYLGKKYFPNYQPWVTVKHLIGRKSIIKQFFRLPKHEINNNITLDMISLEDSYIEQSSDTLESRALKLQNYSFVWQMQRVWQYFINYLFYRLNNQRCFIHAVLQLPWCGLLLILDVTYHNYSSISSNNGYSSWSIDQGWITSW